MFLRSHLVSRLPTAFLRLCGNYVNTTSNSVSYFSPTSSVLSRCNSHTIATSTPQLARHFGASLVWSRPGGRNTSEKVKEGKGARTKNTDDSNGSSSNNGGDDSTGLPNKMICFIFAVVCSFSGHYAVHSMFDKRIELVDQFPSVPQVDFDTFVSEYLRAGKIREIIFVVDRNTAVAVLHRANLKDANEKWLKSDRILVNYPQLPEQFIPDVKKELLEAGLTQGVKFHVFIPSLGWWLRFAPDFVVGVLLGSFLVCTNFGRRMLMRILPKAMTNSYK